MQVQRQIEELLALRASEWLELLPTATEPERAAFAQWLSESRLHVQEFLEIAEIEYRLSRLDPQRQQDIESMLSRIAPNVVALGKPQPAALEPKARAPKRRTLQVAGLLAACITAIAITLFFARGMQITTAIGEQRTVELADTSVITLNASSSIKVSLHDTERDIELQQGEAIFTVAHDPQRPFLVHTRAGTIQAVGTQFNVYDRPNGDTRVSVLEGRVQLTARGSGQSGPPELLEAGAEADIRLDGSIHRNEKAVVANTVAWRQRRLVFDSAALPDMVAEFNRYNRTLRLRLDGVPPDAYHYDGIFDAADPESFISLLEREPDLSIERRGDEVIVRPRAAPNEKGRH